MNLVNTDINVSDYIEVFDIDLPECGKQRVMAIEDLKYLPAINPIRIDDICYCKDCVYRRTLLCLMSYHDKHKQLIEWTTDEGYCHKGKKRVLRNG